MNTARFGALALAVAAISLSGCASYNFRYATHDVTPLAMGPAPPNLMVVDLVDAREDPGAADRQGRKGNSYSTLWPEPVFFQPSQWTDLNTSVRDHLTKSGVAGVTPLWSALYPLTDDDVFAVLEKANGQGVDMVLFMRLVDARCGGSLALGPAIVRLLTILLISGILPLFISESIPINDELCYAEYEFVLADPKGRNLLKTFRGKHSLERTDSSGWGHYPIGEMRAVLKQAFQNGLLEVSRYLASGEEDPDAFDPQVVLGKVPEPAWIPPEGCVLHDSDNPDKPFERPR